MQKCEFSKIIMALIMMMFFAVDIFGGYILLRVITAGDYSYAAPLFTSYLTFNGGVISIATGYYLWKAKNENIQKICANKAKDN